MFDVSHALLASTQRSLADDFWDQLAGLKVLALAGSAMSWGMYSRQQLSVQKLVMLTELTGLEALSMAVSEWSGTERTIRRLTNLSSLRWVHA